MKKFLAILLAMVMVMGCAAAFAEAVDPSTIPDTVESADNTYVVAMVTDVGQLHDKSFNEGTWNGAKLYASENGLTYKYYQPANGNEATDEDRIAAMESAIAGGAQAIVAPGFLQANALTAAAIAHPDVKFIFIDGFLLNDADGNVLTNVAAISFKEEQAGYLAGYAVVKEGFTKLGFAGGGGGTNAACDKYGYGFAQGAEAAAKEMGVQVELKYTWQYGAGFSASPELQTMMSGWYETGTEVVFSCGGSIFDSISAAASANDCYVVGVDVDQSISTDANGNVSTREFVVTSAMKGIKEASYAGFVAAMGDTWADMGGQQTVLGANEDAVGLPVDTWSLENFSVEEYETLLNALKDGTIVVDGTDLQQDAITTISFENVTVIYE